MTIPELDKESILTVLTGVYDAWDAGDADAFVSNYLADASAILPGSYRTSRQEIRDAMAAGFAGPLKGTRTTNNVLDIEMLTDDSAVVITQTGVLIPGESEAPPERTSFATWVLIRHNGQWSLAVYANTPSTMDLQR